MKTIKRDNRIIKPEIKAIIIGFGVSLLLSLLLTAFIAWLAGKGTIGIGIMDILSVAIVFLSAVIGCIICVRKMEEKMLLYSGICGAAYLLFLIAINIIAFDGRFTGMIGKVIAVIAAAVLSGFIRVRMLTTGSKNKFRFK